MAPILPATQYVWGRCWDFSTDCVRLYGFA
jgi:hypothetical protein